VTWPMVALGEVVSLRTGPFGSSLHKEDYVMGGIPLINPTHIRNGKLYPENSVSVGARKLHELRDFSLEVGDVVMARRGEMGRCAAVTMQEQGWLCGTGSIIVKPSKSIDSAFLQRYLSSPNVVRALEQDSVGTTMINLNQKILLSLSLPLPPLADQHRIAAILDRADALRAKRSEAVAKLDQLLQSVFLNMFGDPVINPKNWPKVALVNSTSKIGSGATPKGGDSAYHEEGISLIRSLNVHDGKFRYKNLAFIDDEQAKKLNGVIVESGDVLLNITGASVARVCRVPDDVLPARVNQHVAIIRCTSSMSPVFLECILATPSMKDVLLGVASAGATRDAITKKQIEELLIPIPPLSNQKVFSMSVEKITEQRQRALIALDRQNDLFTSLQKTAFSDGI
jgi:type I restriction enzyme, S subunit